VYNPNATLEQRQDQLRAIARVPTLAIDTHRTSIGWATRSNGSQLRKGTFSRRALNLANTYSNASASQRARLVERRQVRPLPRSLNSGHREFRPQTVNDLVLGINYLGQLVRPRLAPAAVRVPSPKAAPRLMGGFLAEPFEPSSAFPGVNPAVFASMTAAAPVEEPLTAVDLADEGPSWTGGPPMQWRRTSATLDTTPGDGPSVVRMAVALVEFGQTPPMEQRFS
jgi:hypothetical protein